MYPHVVQFETRQREFARELALLREREQAGAKSRLRRARTEARLRRGRLTTRASRTPALEHELTIERKLP